MADIDASAVVRQLTISRLRTVQDTWEPESGDWSLPQARAIAGKWLPADAHLKESDTFSFQERQAGPRETYSSQTLASALGGAGTCTVSYYLTRDGGVAFMLIGLVA